MAGALLGKDASKHFNQMQESEKKPPSRIVKIGRNLLLSLIVVLSMGSLFTGATAKAAIWDIGDQISAAIVNICNPNKIPYTTDTQGWLNSALGTGKPVPTNKENEQGNIWSTYNPNVTAGSGGNNPQYIRGGSINDSPEALNQSNATRAWVAFLRSGDDGNFVYPDLWSDRDKVDQTSNDWRDYFKGDGSVPGAYPANPGSGNAYYYNAPTVALQAAYSAAPQWVIHPSYTRYGFETLDWTVYGSSCYAPERYVNIVPDFLYWLFVQIPTLISFGMLRITLGGDLVSIFYDLAYSFTNNIGTIISPWVALIAIVIGLPFVWMKSKGSIQKMLSGAAWIAAMLFAISLLTENAKGFTEFSQGIVVKVSGTFACTIANQVFAEEPNEIKIGGDAIKDQQYVPVYNDDGTPKMENGEYVWQTRQQADASIKQAAENGAGSDGNYTVTLNDLKGISRDINTECGSYLDGIYNAFWLGVPLQVWAEGEVGAAQAARDRTAEKAGKIGWYQAILNSMYINPNDEVGRATLQSIARWNDAGYTDLDEGKPMQWNIDGHDDGDEGDIDLGAPINNLDTEHKDATVWKSIPFLLNIKFLCKDDATGTIENDGANGADNAADYATNKWLYDGTCITAGTADILNGITGYNVIDRIGLSLVGGWLAMIIFLFTVVACVYIGYQKFVWGFMLIFAPIILGIAAFPDEKRMNFARKYLEFCISNVVKQIVAVMVLVIAVTAMGQIIFPSSDALGGDSFYIPWILKPFVAIMFFLAAALFAIPLSKIMVGAVKGDASVVGKVSKMPADAAKAAAVTTAAVAGIAATGGLGSGALLGTAGKALAGSRAGGLTGSLARVAGSELAGKAGRLNAANDLAAEKAGIAQSDGSLLGNIKRDHALKKATSTNSLANKAALAANKNAAATGAALPYATDKNGNLTRAAQKQAKNDFVAMQKGEFWKSPEFKALPNNPNVESANKNLAKAALAPQFTDADGKVDEKGLAAAVDKQGNAMRENTLARQKAIGQEQLAKDADLPADQRKYLNAAGELTPAGQQKLISDVRGIDNDGVAVANIATASKLMSQNPDHYAQFVTAEKPDGDYRQALSEAQVMNFGAKGAIGETPVHKGFADGLAVNQFSGSQAFLDASAPVVGREMTPVQAAAVVQEMGGAVGSLSPSTQSAFQQYSEALTSDNATPAEVATAHRNVLESLNTNSGLTPTTAAVHEQLISPVKDRGIQNISSDAVRSISDSLPTEASASMRQSLENYATAIDEHGHGTAEAQRAFVQVENATKQDDLIAYSAAASALPMPMSIGQYVEKKPEASTLTPLSSPEAWNRPDDEPPSGGGGGTPLPTPPPTGGGGGGALSEAPRRAAPEEPRVEPARSSDPGHLIASDPTPSVDSAPPRDYGSSEPRRAVSEELPRHAAEEPRRDADEGHLNGGSYEVRDPGHLTPSTYESAREVAPEPRREAAPEPERATYEPTRMSDYVDDSPRHEIRDEAPTVTSASSDYSDDRPAPRDDYRLDEYRSEAPREPQRDVRSTVTPVVVNVPKAEVEDHPEPEPEVEETVVPEVEHSDKANYVTSERDMSKKSGEIQRLKTMINTLMDEFEKVQKHQNQMKGLAQRRTAEINAALRSDSNSNVDAARQNLDSVNAKIAEDDQKMSDIRRQIEETNNVLKRIQQ